MLLSYPFFWDFDTITGDSTDYLRGNLTNSPITWCSRGGFVRPSRQARRRLCRSCSVHLSRPALCIRPFNLLQRPSFQPVSSRHDQATHPLYHRPSNPPTRPAHDRHGQLFAFAHRTCPRPVLPALPTCPFNLIPAHPNSHSPCVDPAYATVHPPCSGPAQPTRFTICPVTRSSSGPTRS